MCTAGSGIFSASTSVIYPTFCMTCRFVNGEAAKIRSSKDGEGGAAWCAAPSCSIAITALRIAIQFSVFVCLLSLCANDGGDTR